MAGEQDATADQAATTGAAASAATGNTGAAASNGEHMIPKSRFDEVNAKLKQLEKAQEQAERERQTADEQRAREQGEWQKLAETHGAKVKELEPFKAKAERFEAALNAQLEVARKDVPAHITALLDTLDPAAQLEWLAANREALGTTNGTATSAAAGAAPRPKPAGAVSDQDRKAKARETLVGTGLYGSAL